MAGSDSLCGAIFILFMYGFSAIIVYNAWGDFHRFKTYVSRQCRVDAVDLERSGKNYAGVWHVTVMDEDERSDVFLIERGLSSFKSYA